MADSVFPQAAPGLLGNIQAVYVNDPDAWKASMEAARSTIEEFNRAPRSLETIDIDRWTTILESLQEHAYLTRDGAREVDIAEFCERQWPVVIERYPSNISALRGLGQAWFLKVQPVLIKIYAEESNNFSSEDSSTLPDNHPSTISNRRFLKSNESASVNSSNYVEARSMLCTSIDFLDRAVAAADLHDSADGSLLELAAEAYLSFANVSRTTINERYYQIALRYLRRASQIPGFSLEVHLDRFLRENLDYITESG